MIYRSGIINKERLSEVMSSRQQARDISSSSFLLRARKGRMGRVPPKAEEAKVQL